MARRRRAKNNLLPKMIGVAVLVNAILLPILAELGVFRPKKGNALMDVKLIKLPPEKKIAQKKPPAKKKVAKAKPHPAARRRAERTAQARPSRPNPNQPHVVAQAGGNGNGPSIENNGTGKVGVMPTAPPPVSTTPAPAPQPTPKPAPPPVEHPTPPVVAAPVQPAPPPAPVYAEAVPLNEPRPEIPDDLSGQEIHATFWGLFTIHADGTTAVKMVRSTGIAELDQAALDAARKWTFKPGTKDGQPIDSFRRLEIDIDVS